MVNEQFFNSVLLIFVLFNPFLMSIYLLDLIHDLNMAVFINILFRATLISLTVFSLFVVGGEYIFTTLLQVRFASFQIFGGVIFLLIGLQYVFKGSDALRQMRGNAEYLAGSVAMPFMIGPTTISVSVWVGTSLGPLKGVLSISLGQISAMVCLVIFKFIYDRVKNKWQPLIERYVDITGRIGGLWTGTFAIQMLMLGLKDWKVF